MYMHVPHAGIGMADFVRRGGSREHSGEGLPDSGELAEIRLKAATGETLTQLELLKFEGYLSALFELNELVFVQYQKKNLDPEYFEAWERRTKAAISVPHVRQFWAKTSTGYRASFVDYINRLMNAGG